MTFKVVIKRYGKVRYKSDEIEHFAYAQQQAKGILACHPENSTLHIVNSVDHPSHFWAGE